jgi:hypothetical protein
MSYYIFFGDSNLLTKITGPSDPIKVFLNDPAAFKSFLDDKKTAKAIWASPSTRMVFTENGNTAAALLDKNKRIFYEIGNQPKADKAIDLLKNNPAEFTRFLVIH